MKLNILLADDHVITMDGISSAIARILPEAQIFQVRDMAAALKHLKHKKTHLMICDINMPGANNFGIIRKIKSIQHDIKILMLSAYSPRLYAQRYLQEGADAYLSKDVDASELERTVLGLVQEKKRVVVSLRNKQENASGNEQPSPLKSLSNRELEVAQMLIEGHGILEIASLLQLHSNTVSTYKTRIFEKMNVLSVPELITVFRNYGH